jgi:hypothetical protein
MSLHQSAQLVLQEKLDSCKNLYRRGSSFFSQGRAQRARVLRKFLIEHHLGKANGNSWDSLKYVLKLLIYKCKTKSKTSKTLS